MQIYQAPNPILSQKAKPIEKINQEILKLIADMKTTLAKARDPEGVGLAAPQVGKSLRIFVIRETPDAPFETFINPVISSLKKPLSKNKQAQKGTKNEVKLEGCLSLKDIWGIVKRHENLKITFLDEKGEKQSQNVSGFKATIIQHETDHLEGILFPKRVLEQKNKLYRSQQAENGETVFEEIAI